MKLGEIDIPNICKDYSKKIVKHRKPTPYNLYNIVQS